jgi:uroporphyrinogen III methyltransferase/synthase
MISGKVYLVGAGPGDPGLLTLKGKQILERADCVVYDFLVNKDLLGLARAEAEKIGVGRRGEADRLRQSQINQLLVARARAGKLVCRLKGGDPFVFGRGGEEAQALAHAGISFEGVVVKFNAKDNREYYGKDVTARDILVKKHAMFDTVIGEEAAVRDDWR